VGVDGAARVLDFGVAKAIGRLQTTRDGQVKGKLAYMAPEHVTGRSVTRACDVFAASVVLWEMLTGKRLFGGGDEGQTVYKILHAPIDPPSQYVPDLPAALDAVVLRGLSREPRDRFATAKDMARALEAGFPLATASKVGDYVESAAGTLLDSRSRELAAIESDVSPTGAAAGAPTAAERAAEATVPEVPVYVETETRSPRRWRLGALLVIVAAAAGGTALLIARRGGGDSGAGAGSALVSTSAPSPSSSPSTAVSFVVPSAAVSTSGEPPASAQPSHRIAHPPPHTPTGGVCDPPFTIDSAGYRHYKRECVR
jgi:serine/threonine-protein kinase